MDPTDPNNSRPQPQEPGRPRSTLARWVSPDAGSSWAALRVNTAVWIALTAVWIIYLLVGDVESYRLVLYPLLIVVAVVQVLGNLAAMRKKRAGESGGSEPGWYNRS